MAAKKKPKYAWKKVALHPRSNDKRERRLNDLMTADNRTVIDVRVRVLVPGGTTFEAIEDAVLVSLVDRGLVQPLAEGFEVWTVTEDSKKGPGYARMDIKTKDEAVKVLVKEKA